MRSYSYSGEDQLSNLVHEVVPSVQKIMQALFYNVNSLAKCSVIFVHLQHSQRWYCVSPCPSRCLSRDGNRTELEPHFGKNQTKLELAWRKHVEPNQTHQCDEPRLNLNLVTQVLVGFDKFVD